MASFEWPSLAGGSGTVTSVGLADGSTVPIYTISGSPVTGGGTLTFTLANESANTIFSGPSSGGAAQPGFRVLVNADFPSELSPSITGLNLSGLTTSTALVADASKNIASSVTTLDELAFVHGVTSAIQTQLNGKQVTGNYITALTGDGTASGPGSAALTLATVNGNVGSFGSATSVGTFTVNAKGLITAAGSSSIQITESQVTNLTADLAAKQSTTLTSAHILVGNISNVATDVAVTGDISLTNSGVTAYSGTVPLNKGGTGQTTKAPAFDALQPMTTAGDLIIGGASGTGTRLAVGSTGTQLTVVSGSPAWVAKPASELWYTGANGYGSTTSNTVRRWTTAQVSTGSDITYNSSATNGDSFTINTAGVYAVTYGDQFTLGNVYFGITKNPTAGNKTTGISAIGYPTVLGIIRTPVSTNCPSSVTVISIFAVNDVICAQTDSSTDAVGGGTGDQIRITRIS